MYFDSGKKGGRGGERRDGSEGEKTETKGLVTLNSLRENVTSIMLPSMQYSSKSAASI